MLLQQALEEGTNWQEPKESGTSYKCDTKLLSGLEMSSLAQVSCCISHASSEVTDPEPG